MYKLTMNKSELVVYINRYKMYSKVINISHWTGMAKYEIHFIEGFKSGMYISTFLYDFNVCIYFCTLFFTVEESQIRVSNVPGKCILY